MVTQPAKNRPAPTEYLARVLRMNPLAQADDVIRLRNQFLGLSDSASVAGGHELHERRAKMTRRIEVIRSHFWTVDLNQLRRELASLRVDDFPDLRMAAERLRTVMEFRSEFPRLARHPQIDLDLFNDYKRAVTLTRREAAAIKARVLDRLVTRDRIKRYQKMVRMMRREFPELYALEEDWLTQIEKVRKRASSRRSSRPESDVEEPGLVQGGGCYCVLGIALYILIKVLVRAWSQ